MPNPNKPEHDKNRNPNQGAKPGQDYTKRQDMNKDDRSEKKKEKTKNFDQGMHK